ncbi:MAG: type II toxin-antitoxin system VapC family toxin [Anaerolineae bacterium]
MRIDFLLHYQDDYLVVPVETPIFQAAGNLVNQHKLRTLDAIQLASAIHTQQILGEPMTFVSADVNLLAAAAAEGFPTDNPHAHP